MGIVKRELNGIFFVIVAAADGSDHTATLLDLTPAFGWFGISLGPLIFGNVTETFWYSFEWMTVMVFRAMAGMLNFRIFESEDQLVKNQ